MKKVSFTEMKNGTKEDYLFLDKHEKDFASKTADSILKFMANPDQKTILIDNAFEEIKNICINLQKDTDATNSELKSLLKLIINEWEEKEEQKTGFGFR